MVGAGVSWREGGKGGRTNGRKKGGDVLVHGLALVMAAVVTSS